MDNFFSICPNYYIPINNACDKKIDIHAFYIEMEILSINCSGLAHGCIQEYYDVLSEYLGDTR